MNRFIEKAHEWGDEIPAGVFLDNRSVSTYTERVSSRIPSYLGSPPAQRAIADEDGRSTADLTEIFEEMRMV